MNNQNRRQSSAQLISALEGVRNHYSSSSSADKLAILTELSKNEISSPQLLRKLHDSAIFLRAFPDSKEIYLLVGKILADFGKTVPALSPKKRSVLEHSGICGSMLYCIYSFEISSWLVRKFPGATEIAWDYYGDPEALMDILNKLATKSEEQTFVDEEQVFEGEEITAESWIRLAKGAVNLTDLTWLLRQFPKSSSRQLFFAELFNKAQVPIAWQSGKKHSSITHNSLAITKPVFRTKGMRKTPTNVSKQILRKAGSVEKLSKKAAGEAIDTAIGMLATRHREVFSLRFPNPNEVYRAPLGKGTEVVLIGLHPKRRMTLETNYTFYITANGIPIGYGGVTPFFWQANTGISIFKEFRGAESSALFVECLRTFRSMFSCSRFIANPYQLGEGNDDALNSGAYWFYFRLGFRPLERNLVRVAEREFRKLRLNRNYRSSKRISTQLSGSALHLRLKDDKAQRYFAELNLSTLALGATKLIAAQGCSIRDHSISKIVETVARNLGCRQLKRWSKTARDGFVNLAPIVGLIEDLDSWSKHDKQTLVALMKSKGEICELDYSQKLRKHDRFRESLLKFCHRERRRQNSRTR